MKPRMRVWVAIGAALGLLVAGTSWIQVNTFGQVPTDSSGPRTTVFVEPAPATAQPRTGNVPSPNVVQTRVTATGFAAYPAGGQQPAGSEIGQLMNELRDADEAKKAELSKKLETAIDTYFDEDMKGREAELARLEERLAKLRNQLERRRRAKDEIIKLQLKVMLNEADGLGFTGASPFGAGELPQGYGIRSWSPARAGLGDLGGHGVAVPLAPAAAPAAR